LPEDHELIILPNAEGKILGCIMGKQGGVAKYEELYHSYKPDFVFQKKDKNTIIELVGRIRRKLGQEPGKPKMIYTDRGQGYSLTTPRRTRAA
jgi:DNA-binding response OmpR family regulator